VIYVLERSITRPVMQRVLRELISKALGKDLQLATSTQQFLRLAKRVGTASFSSRDWRTALVTVHIRYSRVRHIFPNRLAKRTAR